MLLFDIKLVTWVIAGRVKAVLSTLVISWIRKNFVSLTDEFLLDSRTTFNNGCERQ